LGNRRLLASVRRFWFMQAVYRSLAARLGNHRLLASVRRIRFMQAVYPFARGIR
jgi:hypothetical protein